MTCVASGPGVNRKVVLTSVAFLGNAYFNVEWSGFMYSHAIEITLENLEAAIVKLDTRKKAAVCLAEKTRHQESRAEVRKVN